MNVHVHVFWKHSIWVVFGSWSSCRGKWIPQIGTWCISDKVNLSFRALIKGKGQGILPSQFEVYHASVLTSLQQLQCLAIFGISPPTSTVSDSLLLYLMTVWYFVWHGISKYMYGVIRMSLHAHVYGVLKKSHKSTCSCRVGNLALANANFKPCSCTI